MAAPAHANGHMTKQAGGQATRRAIAAREETQRRIEADGQAARESQLATLIGEAVGLHLAPLLSALVAQPECARCIGRAKRLIRDYEIAVKNASQVGEPVPVKPEPPAVARSVTWQDGEPVCFDDYRIGPAIRLMTPGEAAEFGQRSGDVAAQRP